MGFTAYAVLLLYLFPPVELDECNIDIEADAIISTIHFLNGISGVAEECSSECEFYRDSKMQQMRPKPPRNPPPFPFPWETYDLQGPPMLQPEEVVLRATAFPPIAQPTKGYRGVDDATAIHIQKKNDTSHSKGTKRPCKGILPPPVLPSASPHDDQHGVPNAGDSNNEGNPWNQDRRSISKATEPQGRRQSTSQQGYEPPSLTEQQDPFDLPLDENQNDEYSKYVNKRQQDLGGGDRSKSLLPGSSDEQFNPLYDGQLFYGSSNKPTKKDISAPAKPSYGYRPPPRKSDNDYPSGSRYERPKNTQPPVPNRRRPAPGSSILDKNKGYGRSPNKPSISPPSQSIWDDLPDTSNYPAFNQPNRFGKPDNGPRYPSKPEKGNQRPRFPSTSKKADRGPRYPSISKPKQKLTSDVFGTDNLLEELGFDTDPFADMDTQSTPFEEQKTNDNENEDEHPEIVHSSPVIQYKSGRPKEEKPQEPMFGEVGDLPFDVPEFNQPFDNMVPIGQHPRNIQYKEATGALSRNQKPVEEKEPKGKDNSSNPNQNEENSDSVNTKTPTKDNNFLELRGTNNRGNASYRQVLVKSRDSPMYPRHHHMRRRPFQFVRPFIRPHMFRAADNAINAKSSKADKTLSKQSKQESPLALLKSLEEGDNTDLKTDAEAKVENKKKEIDSHLNSILGKSDEKPATQPLEEKNIDSVVPDESGNIYRVRVDLIKPKKQDNSQDPSEGDLSQAKPDEVLNGQTKAETSPSQKDLPPEENEVSQNEPKEQADTANTVNSSPTKKPKDRAWTLINLEP